MTPCHSPRSFLTRAAATTRSPIGGGRRGLGGGRPHAAPGVVGGPDLVGFELDNPRGVAVDEASGYVYVADSGNRRILAVPKGEGPPVELPGVTGLQVPTDLAFDSGEKVRT